MPDFKNLKELEKYINKKIKESLVTDVAQGVKETIKEHVQSDVYDQYNPTMYVRREANGGLLDDDNYLIKEIKDGVSVTNVTTDGGYSEEYYGDYATHPDTWIVPIIESGVGYSWTRSKIYQTQQARPFMANSREELRNGKAKRYLKDSLQKRGLKVE